MLSHFMFSSCCMLFPISNIFRKLNFPGGGGGGGSKNSFLGDLRRPSCLVTIAYYCPICSVSIKYP